MYGSRTNRFKTAAGEVNPPERVVEISKNLYRGGIRYCNALIKDLLDRLKSKGVCENTVLILFVDHGDGFGEDSVLGHHFTVHDSVIKVPLLIRDPTGRLKTGTVSSPASLVDIYPTVLGFAGESNPSPNAIDLSEDNRDFAYTYYDISDHDYYTEAPQKGIEIEELPPAKQHVIYGGENKKGISYPVSGEFVDVAGSGGSLDDRLFTHGENLIRVPPSSGSIGVDAEQRLEDLGYLKK